MVEDLDGGTYRLEVRKRFTHPHIDDVRDAAEPVLQMVELFDDLRCLEVPYESHRTGTAEGAAHRAAYLT